MNEERIKELFADEEYIKGLFELGSYDAASAKLAEDGVVVSSDELKKVVTLAKKKQTGELSDRDLEAVAGGSLFVIGAFLGYVAVMGGLIVGGYEIKERTKRC